MYITSNNLYNNLASIYIQVLRTLKGISTMFLFYLDKPIRYVTHIIDRRNHECLLAVIL